MPRSILLLFAIISIQIGIDIVAFYFIKDILYSTSVTFFEFLPFHEVVVPGILLYVFFVVILFLSKFLSKRVETNSFITTMVILLGIVNSGLLIRFLWYNTPEFTLINSILFVMTSISILLICLTPCLILFENE